MLFCLRVVITAYIIGIAAWSCGNRPVKEIKAAEDESMEAIVRAYDSTIFKEAAIKLSEGDSLPAEAIENFAAAPETRADFYAMLWEFHKDDIFPRQYYNFEKATESSLVEWLMYPTELDTVPSKIELVKKVDLSENDSTFTYYVYRFKTETPHWAAKDGWMIGIVGPYFKDSHPYDWSKGTFSRFKKINETTPKEEVQWTHKNIFRTNNK